MLQLVSARPPVRFFFLYFAQRRARNASDWWQSARGHGREKDERLALPIMPAFFARKFSSRERHLVTRQVPGTFPRPHRTVLLNCHKHDHLSEE